MDALLGQLDRFVDVVESADDHDLLAASRCHGWAVVDVVIHVRTGLQEMRGGVVAVSDQSPDTDAASYWRADLPSNDDGSDDVDRILWTRRTASAYRRPSGALGHLRMAADATRIAVTRMVGQPVSFQGHVLASGDFLATWAVELAVHQLDLNRDIDFGSPTVESLRLGRATVEALVGAPLPPEWSDEMCVLVGSGRTRLTPGCGTVPDSLRVLG